MDAIALQLGLGPTRADFDNPGVLNAINPNPLTGFAHGPIPNNNEEWKPTAYTSAIAAGAKKIRYRGSRHHGYPPVPNAPVALNKENTGVCDVMVNGAQMCGLVFADQVALWRHLRNEHSGASKYMLFIY
ncbi:hypothetical protein N7527_007948 [Penicillium freii]|uniref:Uncharacterized protein n=1 Tax=Penicillium freii TaxID=48697 RepID=A0A101MEQ9_PENFR|nr:hypothetical protein N7527_007948 [Penicillium freii]KUM59083.1 hypothetical protein ACN42_g8063 [Penicillium freii]